MKQKLIVFSLLLMLLTVNSCSDSSNKIESEMSNEIIRMGNLEIIPNAFPKKMNWHDANKACKLLGNGWRLPKIEELRFIAKNTKSAMIWSSTEKGGSHAIVASVNGGLAGNKNCIDEEWPTLKKQFNFVVPVRKINGNSYSK